MLSREGLTWDVKLLVGKNCSRNLVRGSAIAGVLCQGEKIFSVLLLFKCAGLLLFLLMMVIRR